MESLAGLGSGLVPSDYSPSLSRSAAQSIAGEVEVVTLAVVHDLCIRYLISLPWILGCGE